MNNRRKPFEIQIKKNQYLLHLKKLVEINKTDRQLQQHVLKEKGQMEDMIRLSHQLHSHSMKVAARKREQIEIETQRNNYEHIRSTLKRQFSRKLLTVPERHKHNTYLLDIANHQLVEKIVNVKSQFNFKKGNSDKIARLSIKKKERVNTNEDFTQLYNSSIIKVPKINKIQLKLSRSKENVKIRIKFLNNQTLMANINNNPFTIVLQQGQKQKASKSYQLQDLITSQVFLFLPPKDSLIVFAQKIGDKNIPRFKIELKEEEIAEKDTVWITKPVEDMKNRSIGVVQIEMKKMSLQKKKQLSENNENIFIEDNLKINCAIQPPTLIPFD